MRAYAHIGFSTTPDCPVVIGVTVLAMNLSPAVETWKKCVVCGSPVKRNYENARFCQSCRDNIYDKACSYGGTAAEMHARYQRLLHEAVSQQSARAAANRVA
jgi:hypothetical protein